MPSTKNHHVIEAFSPNRADQSLGKGILPGTAGCGDDFFYSQRLYAAAKPVAVNRVAIGSDIAWPHDQKRLPRLAAPPTLPWDVR